MVARGGRADMAGMVGRALRMMAGTLLSRILGLAREVMVAALFGATRAMDAFYVSYTLANLARQLLAEGALSASFVPVFSRVYGRDGADSARKLARDTLFILIAACSAVVLLGVLVSPLLVRIIAPGFEGEHSRLAVSLSRAMFPFLLFVSVGALAMGVLNSVGSFFVPSVAPAASNIAFITVLALFKSGGTIWSLPAAVLAGGACSMLLQCFWACRMGIGLVPSFPDTGNRDLRECLALFLPYAAGLSLNQINPVISRVLGSFLEGGVISALNYADRIIQLPLGLFVIAISQAVLPMLSRIAPEDSEEFRAFIRDALRFNMFIVLPAAIGLILIARPIVHVLLMRGAFDEWAWTTTSGALACYAAGLPGTACNTVLMRALYARTMPKAAVKVTAFTVCANLVLGGALMMRFSYAGLAMGTSCAFTCAAFVAARYLSGSIGRGIGIFGASWFIRLVLSCSVMTGAILAAARACPYPAGGSFALRLAWVLTAVTLGGASYAAATVFLRCPEWGWIRAALARRREEGIIE
ncbi:MAG: murein biosynthesis integral membrane protein MurJ [Synergistaceae bacterium]|nr:murein biosynthesis integral membrane protein MurJ [Synergistaceae bacterium]